MANYVTPTSDKSKKIAFWLCLFGGWIGLHRYYVGKTFTGILYTLSAGGLLVGCLLDLRAIRKGKFTDNVGLPLRH